MIKIELLRPFSQRRYEKVAISISPTTGSIAKIKPERKILSGQEVYKWGACFHIYVSVIWRL